MSPAMKPIGRFSVTSTGRAGFGAAAGAGIILVGAAAAVREGAGRVNVRDGAGGRLKGLTAGCAGGCLNGLKPGCSAIRPSYFGPTYGSQVESFPTMTRT